MFIMCVTLLKRRALIERIIMAALEPIRARGAATLSRATTMQNLEPVDHDVAALLTTPHTTVAPERAHYMRRLCRSHMRGKPSSASLRELDHSNVT
jgi:hypothetical protein